VQRAKKYYNPLPCRINKYNNPLLCRGLKRMIGMAKMIGFMATWTTYRTWLQGDKRGYVKDGTILDANTALEESNRQLLKHDEIKIPKDLRKTVEDAVLQEAHEIGQQVYALAVRSNHVHIVVEIIGKTCGYSVGRFKKAATKALRKYGFSEKVWTKGFDKRYCYNQDEIKA
jgi:REP element-mobilizing transposase RayT